MLDTAEGAPSADPAPVHFPCYFPCYLPREDVTGTKSARFGGAQGEIHP